MFMARREPSRAQLTLQRRVDFHIGEAVRASLAGSYDKAQAHSQNALSIGRELYRKECRHRADLAAALACHAGSRAAYGRIADAVALLTESAGHYAVLARDDPDAYEVRRIDVLTRVALASDAAGNTEGAITLLRELIQMYDQAAASEERDLARARARFHLGRCLLKTGDRPAALAELDAGLADAGRAWELLPDSGAENPTPEAGAGETAGDEGGEGSWLAATPRFVQLTAADWAAAAGRAMVLHAEARRWRPAARAAHVAVRLSSALAALGGDTRQEHYATIRERADAIWAQARQEQLAVE
ncbi:MAG: hypothetical protein FWE35_10010 [Streptosporangiales bacterium]|nr:hypothetical protein [Streptosporangiales bacterium]